MQEYRAIVSLRYYAILEQATPRATLWQRSDAGWSVTVAISNALSFPDLNLLVPLMELYEGVITTPA